MRMEWEREGAARAPKRGGAHKGEKQERTTRPSGRIAVMGELQRRAIAKNLRAPKRRSVRAPMNAR